MQFIRGNPVTFKAEVKEQTPFGAAALITPSGGAPKITVTDAGGTERITDAAMTASATGKYYYIAQTAEAWAQGFIITKVTWTHNALNAVEIDNVAAEAH